jgi:lysozyme family protein
MTRANFNAVMDQIFAHEGGYVDHPRDPGGATNMGITHITLKSYRGRSVTKADVKALTKAEARSIYEANYWNPTKCDEMPAGLDLVMMDGSVNSGIGRGPKWVQAALGVTQDGKVGPATIAAANSANVAQVINKACDARMAFLKRLDTWDTFGKGWTRRVDSVRKEALSMAKANKGAYVPPHPLPPDVPVSPPVVTPARSKALLFIVGAIIIAIIVYVVTQVPFA